MFQNSDSIQYDTEYYPGWMLKKSSHDIHLLNIKPGTNPEKKTEREHLILCGFCNNVITSPKNIIEIEGKHTHVFTNPSGKIFSIGCFSKADGCVKYGEQTMDYTWFSGFEWCCVFCMSCSRHLGWSFESLENRFYGLILDNLKENL